MDSQTLRILEEFKLVKELGDKIGYGNMMGMATALWKKELTDDGYPSTSGAFHGVPKAGIKKDWLGIIENGEKIYDEFMKLLEIESTKSIDKCHFYDCYQGRHKCTSPNVIENKCNGICPFYTEHTEKKNRKTFSKFKNISHFYFRN